MIDKDHYQRKVEADDENEADLKVEQNKYGNALKRHRPKLVEVGDGAGQPVAVSTHQRQDLAQGFLAEIVTRDQSALFVHGRH